MALVTDRQKSRKVVLDTAPDLAKVRETGSPWAKTFSNSAATSSQSFVSGHKISTVYPGS